MIFFMMISYGVFQRGTQDSLVMLSMTCGKLINMCWCVTNIQYYRLVLNDYIFHELVFEATSAVCYVYSVDYME